ncbi:MAG: hypothetical protein WAQ98_06260 [Blastocatellia bacterium]
MKGSKPSSDNKIIYQISLNSRSLGLLNPYLFVEKLQEQIINKLSNVKIKVIYHTKSEGHQLVQLKCFVGSELPVYKANNLKQEIASIAFNLEQELNSRIIDARESVA